MDMSYLFFAKNQARKKVCFASIAAAISLLLSLTVLNLVLPSSALAQDTGTVTGTVTDKESKKPMVGATVTIPELRVGAITDNNGKFSFAAPAGNHTLQIRFVGYETFSQQITVKAGQTLTINPALTSHEIQTNEIVVIGLTGEVDRNKLGNAVSSVSGRDVARVVSPTATDAISGRVPGVQVTKNSGTPGAGTYITIRGRKTIMGSSEPLYVVDGVIIDNSSLYDPNGAVQYSNRSVDINPQDIESIQILKGASAAAIYGAQAGNGVVLITTKRGKMTTAEKPALVTFSTSYQLDTKYGTIPLQTKFGQRVPWQPGKPGSTDSWSAAPLTPGTTTYAQDNVPFRDAFSNEQSLTLSGGVPQFDYLLSGTYSGIQGYVQGSDLKRANLRANLGLSILPGLTLQSNNNYISIDNDLPQDGSNPSGILLGALRTPPEFNNNDYLNPDGSQRRFASYDNPIWTQKENTFKSTIGRFITSTEAKWKPFDWFTLTGRYGLDNYEYNNKQRLAVGAANSPNREGEIDHVRITNSTSNLDLTGTFNQNFMENDLQTTLVLGGQTIWYNRNSDGLTSTTTLPFFNEIGAGSSQTGTSTTTQTKTIGIFGQLTTTLFNRYSLTLGLRRDGSSTFGTADKYHYYPRVSLSYTLSDEPFMKDMKTTFSNIRLRGSWGEAGSPSLPGAYATNFLYGTSGFFDPWGRFTTDTRAGFVGLRQGGGTADEFIIAGALDIKPELTVEREVGIDIGLFENLLSLEATFYHQDVYDMILNVPVPVSTGWDQELRNAGSMWNEGVELGLRVSPFTGDVFAWTTNLTYSRNYNLVTSLKIKPAGMATTGEEYIDLTGGFTGITNVAVVGRPLGVFRGYGWQRDPSGNIMYSTWDAANNEVVGDDYPFKIPMGGSKAEFIPLVGAPIQDQALRIIGDPNPKFQLGWRNDITLFNDFMVSFLFDGVFGFDIWNGTKGALYNFGTHGDTQDRDQPWVNQNGQQVMDYSDPANPKPATKYYYYRYYANGFNINEPAVEDGSFIKLREVAIEYHWHGLKDWNIQTISFTLSGRNLLTITKYKGFDPEVNTFSLAEGRGIDYFTLPQVRSYRFGISVNY